MKYLFYFLILNLLLSCYQVERNCDKFKTGTFEFKTQIQGEIKTTTFYRNDSIEIERYEGNTDTATIRWINDCEYVLKSISPESIKEKKQIHFKILSTDNNTYTFEYNIVNSDKKQKGTAYKVSDSIQFKR
ncbi:MAG: DNA topoisomerase IV [Psychroflexus sp.]|jgi:hypothetical protein|nr:DNA topoisomerase IV [Psychroflexus sp.]MDR9447772.1 DNA topoisomerase IV [Psychroflexus sp.]